MPKKVIIKKEEKTNPVVFDKAVFGVKANKDLIHQALVTYLANNRKVIASTKVKGEVRGGGRKPFKQKGTGNARAGSTRSPLWTGGGITFGPRSDRNFKMRLPMKMKRLAMKMILSDRAQEKRIIIDDLKLKAISTKVAREFLTKSPIESGKILLFLAEKAPIIELSFRNLPYVKVIQLANINIYDLLNHEYYLMDQKTLTILTEAMSK